MGKRAKAKKKSSIHNHQEFFRHFFTCEELSRYTEKQVGDWWLLNIWDDGHRRWWIYVYSPQSYANYKRPALAAQARKQDEHV